MNTNFDFVTNFGRFPISELMQTYVFEGIFTTMEQFFNLRLQIKNDNKDLIRKLLILSFKSFEYKAKPVHEKQIRQYVAAIRNFPQLLELCEEFGLDPLSAGGAPDEAKDREVIQSISQATKLKVLMQTCKSDPDKVQQISIEFNKLVNDIINIDQRSKDAFKGANTIKRNEFIESLIKSSDVTSDISVELRTSSLTIIRKIIESENKKVNTPAAKWESEDWDSYAHQIKEAQDMLNKLDVVSLLCRLIQKEKKRAIIEEAIYVAIAVLLGGNNTS